MPKADTLPTRFAIRHKFEELAIFWHFDNGTPWRAGRLDGAFEITYDITGDYTVTAVEIAADNGKVGNEADARMIALDADEDESFYLLVLDAIHGQYHTRILEWIDDDLADEGLRRIAA